MWCFGSRSGRLSAVDRQANRVALSESYLRRDEVSAGLPTYLIIESTSLCNLACVMCPYKSMNREHEHMAMDLYDRIISEASGFVEFAWLHMFSEPLLNKNIYQMIDRAEEAGIRTGLSTNSTPLNETAARKLLDSKLSFLLLSLDGATKEVYEYIRAGADFELVERNVQRFAQLRRSAGNDRLKVVLSIINMKPNEKEIEGFVERWRDQGFDCVVVKPFHFWAGQDAEITVLGEAPWMAKFFDVPSRLAAGDACYEPWLGFAILADGTAVPCCNDFDGRQMLGNLNSQSIGEIWNGNPMRTLRRMFRSSAGMEGTICEKCPFPCASSDEARGGHGPFDVVRRQLDFYMDRSIGNARG